jgi:maltokinase
VINVDAVRDLLRDQRWFGADADAAEIARVRALPTDPPLTQLLVAADADTYQLVITEDGQDATTDQAAAVALLGMIVPDAEVTTVRPLGVEQSNTSLVFDERLLLKLFRRVPAGPHPDAEVPAALALAGFDNVPPLRGRWQEDDRDFAVIQPFLAGATDGWALGLVSLRQLFSEPTDPADAGGDFGHEAERLGRVTADLHAAMAKAFGTAPADATGWANAIADGLRTSELHALGDAGSCIRVHGDYHLGQVIRTDETWSVVDFEGEPARREADRQAHSSPLKDVAGMLRSFDYAAAVAAREQADDRDEVADLARSWEQRNRAAFLRGYFDSGAVDDLLPRAPDAVAILLSAFELDKALYEVAYETAHRPAWVDIPKAAVARLVA